MTKPKKIKAQIIILYFILFFQVLLLTNLVKCAIIKTRAINNIEHDHDGKEESSVVQSTAVSNITSETTTDSVQLDPKPSLEKCDLHQDGVIDENDFTEYQNLLGQLTDKQVQLQLGGLSSEESTTIQAEIDSLLYILDLDGDGNLASDESKYITERYD